MSHIHVPCTPSSAPFVHSLVLCATHLCCALFTLSCHFIADVLCVHLFRSLVQPAGRPRQIKTSGCKRLTSRYAHVASLNLGLRRFRLSNIECMQWFFSLE